MSSKYQRKPVITRYKISHPVPAGKFAPEFLGSLGETVYGLLRVRLESTEQHENVRLLDTAVLLERSYMMQKDAELVDDALVVFTADLVADATRQIKAAGGSFHSGESVW